MNSVFLGYSMRNYLLLLKSFAPYLRVSIHSLEIVMQVIFESRHPDGSELREQAVARVRFAMRRLSALVPRAKVRLSDVNGPRGGVDKRCQLALSTVGAGEVVITTLAQDWRTALDLSLGRATRALKRALRRQQKPARTRWASRAIEP